MRVGVGEQRVRGLHDKRAHAIRSARLHRAQHQIGMSRRKVARRELAPEPLCQARDARVAIVALQRRDAGVEAQRLKRIGVLER